ncbi:hypothetical protein B0H14DRAFT_3670055 [Mycena olivaceomarginata]|nr:hypothetical protein B0H14DRAFT_3670055 [Mycena olivaceomarginata]
MYFMPSRSYVRRFHSRSGRHNRLVPLPIIKSADPQPSIFHQKLKVGSSSALPFLCPLSPLPSLPPPSSHKYEYAWNDASLHRLQAPKPVPASSTICADGGEIPDAPIGFTNDAVQRCLEAATGPEERRQIVACMRDRIVDLTTIEQACVAYAESLSSRGPTGAADLCIVRRTRRTSFSHRRRFNPFSLSVDKSLKRKWAALAYHETGHSPRSAPSRNRGERQDGIIDELLAHGAAVFSEVAKNQWGSYCIQHKAPQNAAQAPPHCPARVRDERAGQQECGQAPMEGGKETLDRVVQPAKRYAVLPSFLSCSRLTLPVVARHATIVNLALAHEEQVIASVLPPAKKDRCAALYDCIRAHIAGSKVIWLLHVHPIQFVLNPLSSVFFSSDRMRALLRVLTYIR